MAQDDRIDRAIPLDEPLQDAPEDPPGAPEDPPTIMATGTNSVGLAMPIRQTRVFRPPQFLTALLSNRKAAFGLAILAIMVLLAIFAPQIARYNPQDMSAAFGEGPSPQHWFGTTQQGEDVFSQVVWGARVSLMVGAGAAVLSTLISASLGMIAAYVSGVVDEFLNLVTNVFIVIPALPLLIVISSYLPYRGPISMIFIIAFTTWAGEARVLRSQALTLRSRDFVLAAKTSGESVWRIVFGEIMPNMTSRIAAGFLGAFVGAILFEAGLEYLGFGSVDTTSWGMTLYWAQNNAALETGQWWHFVFAGLAIAVTGSALIFINYGIDEISNPRLKRVKMPKQPKRGTRPVATPAVTRGQA